MTFKSLIATHEVSTIDRLMTDTEGYDARILASFPFDVLRPRQILFEYKHSDGVFHIGHNFAKIVTMLDAPSYNIRIADDENCLATSRP